MEDYRLEQSGQEVQNILNSSTPQSDLDAEILRAGQAEQALDSKIDAEETRAKAAEKQNADDIDAEELARQQADQTLDGKIGDEEIRAKAAEKQNADDIDALEAAIQAILLLIPSAATSLNQLADKAFVNSSIATASATFRGTYNLVTDLSLTVSATHTQIATALGGAVSGEDNNDYAFVQVPTSDATPTQIAKTERYKFNGTAWEYEYDLNNSGYTAAQWAAINSGITAALVSKLSALPTNAELTTALGVLTEGIAAINAKIPSAASSSNKLVDNSSMVAYIGQIIDAIDATFNVTSTDGHVTVQITQVNGVITNVAVTTSDIASAAALTLVTGRVTDAEANIVSLGGRMTTAEDDIDDLQQLYNNLQQSAPVVIEPTDTWPVAVADRSATVIYRVVDRVNTPPQYYSDYMFRASDLSGQPVLMGQYDNAIDPRPKKGSQNLVTSGGVFDNMGAMDVSELNATENPHTLATYADLSAALAAIPSDYQKGGMSIKFVQSSDNKYVQYRLMTDTFNTTVTNWQGVDEEPTAGSENLINSNGVANSLEEIKDNKANITHSVNLYNRDSTKLIVNTFIGNDGFVTATGYNVSHPIFVYGGVSYTASRGIGLGNNANVAFVTEKGALISIFTGTISGDNLIFTPPKTGLIAVNLGSGSISDSQFMVCETSKWPNAFVPFSMNLSPEYGLDASKLYGNVPGLSEKADTEPSVNLFDKNNPNIQNNKFIGNDGYVNAQDYKVTYPIAVSGGITYRSSHGDQGLGNNTNYAICNEDGTIVSVQQFNVNNDVYTFTPVQDCFVVLNLGRTMIDSFMLCEVNEWPDQYEPYYVKVASKYKLDASQLIGEIPGNPLKGKILALDGDSICHGDGQYPDVGGYGKLIAERNGMEYENKAVGGATIKNNTYYQDQSPRHWICESVSTLRDDADYIIIEGGVNDGTLNIGEITSGFDGPFDMSTFCGAMEQICYVLNTRFAGKKVGFVLVHRMAPYYTYEGDQTNLYWLEIKILEKWGIPFVDLNKGCPPFEAFEQSSLTALNNVATTFVPDGWHPNTLGYLKYYCDKIEAWMKTL